MIRVATLIAALALLGISASHGAELSADELKAARKIYTGKCAKCHKLYDPSAYTPEKWSEWTGKMTKKSKLKPAQVELLARYIEAGKSGRVELPKPRRAEADGPAD